MITLTLREASPSLNEHIRKHWVHHHRLARHWSMLVMEAKSAARIGQPSTPAHAELKVTRFGIRSLDTDNFVGGLKPLIDALKNHGFIADDDPAHLTLTTAQMRVAKGDFPCTLVQITPRS